MKKLMFSLGFLTVLILLYGCVSQQSAQTPGTPSEGDPGIVVFTKSYTFSPGCTDVQEASELVNHSSNVIIGWDRDSVGTAKVESLRPSADVGDGQLYVVICNESQQSITVPAESVLSYEIFNGTLVAKSEEKAHARIQTE